eukprot:gene17676-20383_t
MFLYSSAHSQNHCYRYLQSNHHYRYYCYLRNYGHCCCDHSTVLLAHIAVTLLLEEDKNKDTGLAYTIVHRLLDKQGGENKVIMDFDDTLLQRKTRTIPRDDVAEVCIQSLTDRNAQFRSFDVITEPYAETEEKKMNWLDFFSKKGNNKY